MNLNSAKSKELVATLHVFNNLSRSAILALQENDTPRLKYFLSALEQLTSTEAAHFKNLVEEQHAPPFRSRGRGRL